MSTAIPGRPTARHALARAPLAIALGGLLGLLPAAGFAQTPSGEVLAELKRQLDALKAEQADRDLRIGQLERALAEATGSAAPAAPAPVAPSSRVAGAPATPAVAAGDGSRLKISGDLRVRAQGDYSDDLAPNRNSAQVRARLGATYAISDRVLVGARIATGDPDDPNSTDVQLSNFADDLQVSLDQAYLQLDLDQWKLFLGKFPQPFSRTDLVWDSDVNPQGIAATYRGTLGNGAALRANTLFFVVDESAAGPDSTMTGLQLGFDSPRLGDWQFDVTAGYYDYRLGSMAGGDAGDFRSNLRDADGRYLSDFDLVNVLGGATYSGFGTRWPLRASVDYVKNRGASTDADTGYAADIALGRTSQPGDWRLTYGFQQAQTDAVFAAFSHDNLGLATNYRLNSLTLDYATGPRTLLTGIWYHYRPLEARDAGARDPHDWLDRFRLAFLVNF